MGRPNQFFSNQQSIAEMMVCHFQDWMASPGTYSSYSPGWESLKEDSCHAARQPQGESHTGRNRSLPTTNGECKSRSPHPIEPASLLMRPQTRTTAWPQPQVEGWARDSQLKLCVSSWSPLSVEIINTYWFWAPKFWLICYPAQIEPVDSNYFNYYRINIFLYTWS